MKLQTWFEQQWQTKSWAQLALLPLSWLFGLLVKMRRLCYRCGLLKTKALPVPVVVVGNIAVGGSGKTPVVIDLVLQLKKAGFHPGVISRGYGGRQVGEVFAHSAPSELGDEPVLIAQRAVCPVWVNPDRVQAGRDLLYAHPECDIVISDDGLQHYRLKRDIEIAVVQHPYGLGNRRLLPAGPLREAMSRLKQVHALVETGDTGATISPDNITPPQFSMTLQSRALVSLDQATTKLPSDFLGQTFIAVAGIAHPQRFFNTLQQLGLQIETHSFVDHHGFVLDDFKAWQNISKNMPIVMTEKDAVKCRSLGLNNAWYLPVQADISHPQGLTLLDIIKIKEQ